MIFSLFLALQTASASLPQPLTETHMRDIGCVATLGLVADEQRRGKLPSLRFPNVMERGKKYAGIVGDRITFESGQPKEVVALAIKRSVEDQQQLSVDADSVLERKEILDGLMAQCLPLLDAEVPAEAPTPDDYSFCSSLIGLSAWETEKREGKDSIDAQVMTSLSDQLFAKFIKAKYGDTPSVENRQSAKLEVAAGMTMLLGMAEKQGGLEALAEAEGKEKYQRCIFLGE